MSDQLKPGRELDALIERRVFGREPKSKLPCVQCGAETYGRESGCAFADCRHDGPDTAKLPRYSTEIGAAWLVVEHLLTTKAADKFHLSHGDTFPPEWNAHFLQTRQTDTSGALFEWRNVDADAETAPHSICLAALKAVA